MLGRLGTLGGLTVLWSIVALYTPLLWTPSKFNFFLKLTNLGATNWLCPLTRLLLRQILLEIDIYAREGKGVPTSRSWTAYLLQEGRGGGTPPINFLSILNKIWYTCVRAHPRPTPSPPCCVRENCQIQIKIEIRWPLEQWCAGAINSLSTISCLSSPYLLQDV